MPERAIIADDLTGALDAAAPFAMRGISTAVALDVEALPEALATGAQIIGVSTDSREIAPDAANEAVAKALSLLPTGTSLFKKVDSRLKGNIEAELDALPHRRSLVVPAIPAFGRWMREGRLGGFGVAEPIDIAGRLGRHGASATIPDIESQADIERVLGTDFDLPIGARSLAEAMALTMAPVAALSDLSLLDGPAYCVIGSTDPITLLQLETLRAQDSGLAYIAAPNGQAPDQLPPAACLTVLHAVPGSVTESAAAVADALGKSLARLAPGPGSLLILSGGATAQVILRQLGIRVLHLLGEVEPGLPLSLGGSLTVITKSGGFGDGETLARVTASYRSIGSPAQHHVG